ncbi:DMT family transporter [Streptomyces sp. NPDC059816]|uniref:DMT family transporter n=1 Tax=Streptomyces sp. NPDC059816 TaxID=3346960 RepID=UPI0036505D37
MSGFVLAVVLCLVSAVAYAGGAIVQERVAANAPDRVLAALRRPAWWGAVGLNGVGAVLHVIALAYGPLSLVQPLGALTIVFALPMAAYFVHRKAGAAAWRGALMATVGLAGLLSLMGAADDQSMDGQERVVLALVTAGVLVTLTVAGRAAHRHPAVRSVLLAGGAGVAFGIGSVFTKAVAVDWAGRSPSVDVMSLVVIAVMATAGMFLSQSSYRGAGLAAPLSTVTVVNPVVATAVGLTLFGETFRYGATGTLLALGCGVVAAGGLILLTTERIGREQQAGTSVTADEESDTAGTGAGDRPDDEVSETDVLPGRRPDGAVPGVLTVSSGVSAVPSQRIGPQGHREPELPGELRRPRESGAGAGPRSVRDHTEYRIHLLRDRVGT